MNSEMQKMIDAHSPKYYEKLKFKPGDKVSLTEDLCFQTNDVRFPNAEFDFYDQGLVGVVIREAQFKRHNSKQTYLVAFEISPKFKKSVCVNVNYLDKVIDTEGMVFGAGGYYFWDESGLNKFGPFKDVEECSMKRDMYNKEILGEK